MGRRVWNILCITSLTGAAAMAVLWAHSEKRLGIAGYHWMSEAGAVVRFCEIRSEQGTLGLNFGGSRLIGAGPHPVVINGFDLRSRRTGDAGWEAAMGTLGQGLVGFELFHSNYSLPRRPPFQYRVNRMGAALPDGVLILLLMIAPAWRLETHLRTRRRRREGLCLKCGYDLRATPDAAGPLMERCPECGREAVKSE